MSQGKEENVTLGAMLKDAVDTVITEDVLQHDWAKFTYQFSFTARRSLKNEVMVADLEMVGPIEVGDAKLYQDGVQPDDVQAVKKKVKKAKLKKDSCEFCGFKAVHPCQLDIDHIDGNHGNNDPANLRTLCANCHRLKTFMNGDHLGTVYED